VGKATVPVKKPHDLLKDTETDLANTMSDKVSRKSWWPRCWPTSRTTRGAAMPTTTSMRTPNSTQFEHKQPYFDSRKERERTNWSRQEKKYVLDTRTNTMWRCWPTPRCAATTHRGAPPPPLFTEKIAIEQRIFMMLLEAQDTQVSVAHGREPAPRK
jgi:hypothetical protein